MRVDIRVREKTLDEPKQTNNFNISINFFFHLSSECFLGCFPNLYSAARKGPESFTFSLMQ